jgi:hypothetical protein
MPTASKSAAKAAVKAATDATALPIDVAGDATDASVLAGDTPERFPKAAVKASVDSPGPLPLAAVKAAGDVAPPPPKAAVKAAGDGPTPVPKAAVKAAVGDIASLSAKAKAKTAAGTAPLAKPAVKGAGAGPPAVPKAAVKAAVGATAPLSAKAKARAAAASKAATTAEITVESEIAAGEDMGRFATMPAVGSPRPGIAAEDNGGLLRPKAASKKAAVKAPMPPPA